MSQTFESTETVTIEALDFIYEDEMELMNIKPKPKNQVEVNPVKLKRLTCNLKGCTYSTDRRRDLKRHRRSQKHLPEDICSDSETEIDRSLFCCKVCEYTTASRYCYLRHKGSRRHIMKELNECEKLIDETDDAESHNKIVSESDVSQVIGDILYSCTPCNFNTTKKSCLEIHTSTQAHKDVLHSVLEPNDYIEYISQEKGQMIEPSEKSAEIEDEYYAYIDESSSTMKCAPCEYITARRFCFVRHLRSMRHMAKIQAHIDALEEKNDFEQVDDLIAENLDVIDESSLVEEFDGGEDKHDLQEQYEVEDIDVLTEIDDLEGQHETEDIDSLVEVDGQVHRDSGFERIEYAPGEESVYEEIVYLPAEDNTEEICYFLALNNN
ncbi:uncharacterized protein LOC108117184 [Drosophila eugracilis]|uniref:uncharacterized protein LOC108117184 n=1 Tax=Drosophila eugracilis TaxID=29029 RepID=UPI001BDAD1A5|nr:uncharacterized protein LOC108117184 [Drosophila eugracilis]